MNRTIALVLALGLAGCPKPTGIDVAAQTPASDGLPERPEAIAFPDLSFDAPKAEDYRLELSSGVPVYLSTSTEFPLVDISLTFRGGRYLDPVEHIGVGDLLGIVLRTGGTAEMAPAAFDERLEFLATDLSVSVGSTRSYAGLNTLKDNLDESLDMLGALLRTPGMDADRVRLAQDNWLESMKQRNDDASDIAAREWAALMYGADHYLAREATIAHLEAIDEAALRAAHGRIFHPGNLVIRVSGDVTAEEILPRLEAMVDGWEVGETAPDIPVPQETGPVGLFHVQKDIPQGKVRIGIRSVTRDDPDAIAIELMNDILGGGGFTSRITKRVRSDEGLAYSAGSAFRSSPWFPGTLEARYESKNETVALAAKIVLDEFARIAESPVSEEELATAKGSFIEAFPRRFASRSGTLDVFVDDALTNRPEDYWQTWRDKVSALTAEDLTRVAKRVLRSEELTILVVGDWEPIAAGNERANMQDVWSGEVTHLPLRDPLTMEPVADGKDVE